MKAIYYLSAALLVTALYSCDSHTYEEIEEDAPVVVGNVTYTANVKSIIDAECVSCHSAGGSGAFRPLTNFNEVKAAVQSAGLLDRIQLQNSQPGVMPQTGRMTQAKINLILQWNEDGLLEN